jgi:uncharacterized protein YjbI with pentapeptide repeats
MKKNKIVLLMVSVVSFIAHGYVYKQVEFIKKQALAAKVRASNTDLRGAPLSGLQAAGGNFVGAVFHKCNQNDNNDVLGYCVPGQEADLSGADLTGADFTNTNLQSVNFKGATLDNTIFLNTSCAEADFTGVSWSGITVVDKKMVLSNNPDLTEDDLKDADLSSYQMTIFCNATMPDGTVCSGDSWTDPDGNIFMCNCQSDDSSDDT